MLQIKWNKICVWYDNPTLIKVYLCSKQTQSELGYNKVGQLGPGQSGPGLTMQKYFRSLVSRNWAGSGPLHQNKIRRTQSWTQAGPYNATVAIEDVVWSLWWRFGIAAGCLQELTIQLLMFSTFIARRSTLESTAEAVWHQEKHFGQSFMGPAHFRIILI